MRGRGEGGGGGAEGRANREAGRGGERNVNTSIKPEADSMARITIYIEPTAASSGLITHETIRKPAAGIGRIKTLLNKTDVSASTTLPLPLPLTAAYHLGRTVSNRVAGTVLLVPAIPFQGKYDTYVHD